MCFQADPNAAVLDLVAVHGRCLSVSYHAASNVMAVAGLPENVSSAAMESATISFWQLFDTAPYFLPPRGQVADSATRKPVLKHHTFESASTLVKIAFNRSGDLLASLDPNGQLSVFRNGLRVKTYSSEVIYQATKGDGSIIDLQASERVIKGPNPLSLVRVVLHFNRLGVVGRYFCCAGES